jgi:prepilin-type N-terminal cleavage/methylation domain-containing protein
MNVQQKNKEKGFTIIEVVLVLAIAGLIFLMVFVALPALQRGQRDTQRRDDVSRFISQLTSYSTNNRGALPDQNNMNGFLTSYMKSGTDGEFNDPLSGAPYDVGTGDPTTSKLQYRTNAQCDGEKIVTGGGTRQAAVSIALEGSGFFCQNAK